MVPLFAVVLALIVAWMSSGDEPASPIYAEDLRESLVELARRAGPYEDSVVDIGETGRVRLIELSDDVLEGVSEVRAMIADAPSDPEMAGSLAILEEAAGAWETGVGAFRTQLLRAADEPDAVGVEVTLTNSLIDLLAGDRLYVRFVDGYGRAGAEPPVAGFPDVSLLSDGYPIGGAATQLVELARSADSPFRLRPNVSIDQVVTDPELVLNTDEQLVAVYTETLSVNVVVVNDGNGASDPVDLSLELVGPLENPLRLSATVDALSPGSKTTVSFEELAVIPGGTYQLRLTLPLAENEEQSEDNLQAFTFRVNEQTSSDTTAG